MSVSSLDEIIFTGKNKGKITDDGVQCDEAICQYFNSDNELKQQPRMNNKFVKEIN